MGIYALLQQWQPHQPSRLARTRCNVATADRSDAWLYKLYKVRHSAAAAV